jgi:hypothetical protein
MKKELFFCSSLIVPEFCIYNEKPVVCCFRCDIQKECWEKQNLKNIKKPCWNENTKFNKKCEFLF